MSTRIMHFTTQGFKPQLIDIARDGVNQTSKRSDIIEDEEKLLNQNLNEFKQTTKERNLKLERRLNEVWDMSTAWEAKLNVEKEEAVESIHSLKEEYQGHLKKFNDDMLCEIKQIFDKYDNELFPVQVKRVDAIEADYKHYFSTTVPAAIEAQSGEVSRQLKKEYETFDIEKQKERNREKKFILRGNAHIQTTAQKHLDEDALMSACFYNLTDDVVEHERRAARMHNRRWDLEVQGIIELRDLLTEECRVRAREDMDVLDTILDTQQRLQVTILEHFGMAPEDMVKMSKTPKKLNARMAKINAKKGGKKDAGGSPLGSARKKKGGKKDRGGESVDVDERGGSRPGTAGSRRSSRASGEDSESDGFSSDGSSGSGSSSASASSGAVSGSEDEN